MQKHGNQSGYFNLNQAFLLVNNELLKSSPFMASVLSTNTPQQKLQIL
jgi:hypothetical protein